MRNPVARQQRRFNRPATHTDRKKAAKRGYHKHRNNPAREPGFLCVGIGQTGGGWRR